MVALVTLVVGFIIGYLGQRSRFCIISGIRDFTLFRDTYRIKGLFALIIGSLLGLGFFKLIGGTISAFPAQQNVGSAGYFIASAIGGLGVGFFSVLSEGCPFRQHVMAGEGKRSAIFYLIGFYIGIIYFIYVTVYILDFIMAIAG